MQEMDSNLKYLTLRKIVAEFGGTGVLLFMGCMGCLRHLQFEGALSFSAGLVTAIQIFGNISGGHFNPAVTVAYYFFNELDEFPLMTAILYILAQVSGATGGFILAMFLAPKEFDTLSPGSVFCNTIPAVDEPRAFFLEFSSTLFLVLLCCSIWDARSEGNRDSVPLKLGFFLCGIVQAIGYMTGASLNPARTFGPSLINSNWELHWVYWVAPMLAGVMGSLCYKFLFLKGNRTAAT